MNPEEHNINKHLKSKFIEYYDDIVPVYMQDYLENLVKSKMEPFLGLEFFYSENLSLEGKDAGEYGFGCNIQDSNPIYYHPQHHLITTPLYLFCNALNLAIFKIHQIRSWIQTPQEKSNTFLPHKDHPNPHYVLLYYVNDSDGDTVFFEDDEVTEIKRISPKKGRIAFFDGSIYHAASNPTLNPRLVFNYNFIAFDTESLKNIFPLYKTS